MQKVNEEYQDLKSKQNDLERKIDAELCKGDAQQQTEKLNAERVQLQQNIRDSRTKATEFQNRLDMLEQSLPGHQQTLAAAAAQLNSSSRALSDIDQQIRDLSQTQRDKMNAYGSAVPKLLKEIDAEKRWTKKPIGPV